MKKSLVSQITVFMMLLSAASFSQWSFQPSGDTVLVIRNSDTLDIPWAGGFHAPQFSRVDLNLDGKEDLIAFDRSDLQVIPLINMGDSNEIRYKYAPEYKNIFPKSVGWMLMRDYNNDGKKDVFFTSSGGNIVLKKNISTSKLEFKPYFNYSPRISYDSTSLMSNQYPGGIIPIYIPNTDIPAIFDVNGDGDLDILTFGVLGDRVEYHKNLAMETYGNADTCDFHLKNYCWGHFLEVGLSTNKLRLLDTCSYNVPSPEIGRNPTGTGSRPLGSGSRHAGSTVTAFHNNGDDAVDLLMGDVSFNNLVMAQNGGIIPDQNTSITSQDTAFPSYDTSTNIMLFPASYIEDVDNDGLNDLIVAPNIAEFSENHNQIWFYKNEGTNTSPIFRLKKKTLFEEETIDVGENSIPELFDHNGDSLMDLIVSTYGYFNRDSITYECKISLYENIGTIGKPVFQFVTDDYQSIHSLGLGTSLHPTFGDIDGDGDEDMILGNSEGYLHFFTNTAGAGSVANFTLTSSRLQDNLGNTIDVGQFSAPQLFDYENDGDLDLIVGKNNGRIRYYENIGTTTAFSFKQITDTLGRVEINEWYDPSGTQTGYATPRFYRNGTKVEMYCGSQPGGVFKYTGINPANPRQTFIIDTVIENSTYGKRSVPLVYDFLKDGKIDMISGNNKGGLNFFTRQLYVKNDASNDTTYLTNQGGLTNKTNSGPNYSALNEIEDPVNFNLYPNPATESVTINLSKVYGKNQQLKIIDITGKLVMQSAINNTQTILDISSLRKGIYFVTLISDKGQKTRKLVVQ